MSDTALFVNCDAGDELGAPAFFRCTFEPFLWSAIVDVAALADKVYEKLRGGTIDYATPINTNDVAAGDTVFTFDVQIFPGGAHQTCAQLFRALNGLNLGASMRKLERIDQGDAIGSAGVSSRAEDQAQEEQTKDADSLVHQLAVKAEHVIATVGWVLLVALILFALFYGRKLYKEFS